MCIFISVSEMKDRNLSRFVVRIFFRRNAIDSITINYGLYLGEQLLLTVFV